MRLAPRARLPSWLGAVDAPLRSRRDDCSQFRRCALDDPEEDASRNEPIAGGVQICLLHGERPIVFLSQQCMPRSTIVGTQVETTLIPRLAMKPSEPPIHHET